MRISAFCQLLATALLVTANVAVAKDQTADQVLRAVSERLDSLNAVAFDHSVEFNYASQGYHHTASARGYIEWGADNPLGARLRFNNPELLYVYNGSEAFSYYEAENAFDVIPQPKIRQLRGTFFTGSLYSLRRAIPTILSTDSVEKAILNGDDPAFHYVELRIPSATIGYDGAISPLTRDLLITYDLKIDKQTLIPVDVTQRWENGDFIQTSLSAFDFAPSQPPEKNWYYSTFTNAESQNKGQKTDKPFISVGESAPDWTLASYPGGDDVSLSDFRGRPILLVFWISHCGPSQDAVPAVNALFEMQKEDGLAVVSVNPYDPPNVIDLFVKNNSPKYPILVEGQAVVDAYRAPGYPMAVLVDPGGKVAYSGMVDEQAIRKAVDSLLR